MTKHPHNKEHKPTTHRGKTMSTNLQKIRAMVATASAALAGLKPSSTMDDLDKVAHERALLREKLSLLTSAEAEELERLEQIEREEHAKRRRADLMGMAKRLEGVTVQHNKLTDKANALISELAGVLVAREACITAEIIDFNAVEILTPDEKSELTRLLLSTHRTITSQTIGSAWRYGVALNCDGIDRVRFGNLIPATTGAEGAPLEGFSPRLAEQIKAFASA